MLKSKATEGTVQNLPSNSRFYVLISTFLLSVVIMAWLRTQIDGDQLFYIRLEQVFGLMSVIYLYAALMTSPISKIFARQRWVSYLLFARRSIGVSSAYFAVLHMAIALWGQIGGLTGIGFLPDRFKWALVFGAIAIAVLLAMAATSFNKVITLMTFKRWKMLHRLVYAGGILIILHVWMIGTHVAYSKIQIIALVALSIFFALESYRIAQKLVERFSILSRRRYLYVTTASLWLFWTTLLVVMPNLVKNYHNERHEKHDSSLHSENTNE